MWVWLASLSSYAQVEKNVVIQKQVVTFENKVKL